MPEFALRTCRSDLSELRHANHVDRECTIEIVCCCGVHPVARVETVTFWEPHHLTTSVLSSAFRTIFMCTSLFCLLPTSKLWQLSPAAVGLWRGRALWFQLETEPLSVCIILGLSSACACVHAWLGVKAIWPCAIASSVVLSSDTKHWECQSLSELQAQVHPGAKCSHGPPQALVYSCTRTYTRTTAMCSHSRRAPHQRRRSLLFFFTVLF